MTRGGVAAWVLVACVAAACERESREFRTPPPVTVETRQETGSPLFAGAPLPPTGTTSPYLENGWAISEGKRLYKAFNCSGCHAQGGGGIGPALMDDEWRYGFTAANVFSSIVEGRPNGMPSFRGKLTEQQVWQLVAYVQSMSGQAPIDAASGRSDHMQARPPDTIQPYAGRVQTGHQ
jgi:cytochrome c oxidase cbb3-type subunit 3